MITEDKEKSFKARLRNIAKETNRNPANLWQSVVLERLLVRLGQSPFRHQFIFKGGMLLGKYVPIGRETMDLDFLGINISNNKVHLEKTFNQIARINLDDGFIFKDIEVRNLVHSHMMYVGVEISMLAHFGGTYFPVAIDVGFGDHVVPIEKHILLTHHSKGPLFEEKINLLCYPLEFIFAEKLETLIFRGSTNSRMKDFHDLHTILHMSELSYEALKIVIISVFKHRQTPLSLPLKFTEKDISLLQAHWSHYRSRLSQAGAQILPMNISECINNLNNALNTLV